MLDLFSGTGSLAKVALSSADMATCVNIDTSVIAENVMDYCTKCEIIEAKAEDYVPVRYFDLAVVDSYYEEALTLLPSVLTNIQPWCSMILVNGGPSADRYWTDEIQSVLQHYIGPAVRLSDRQHAIYLCHTRDSAGEVHER